jgi:acyl-CoA synthetase (AMP-forming)/AMP-acid ligase II
MTLATFVDTLAREHGHRAALLGRSEQLSFHDLQRQVDDLAHGLARQGVNKGARVGVLMPNQPQWLISAFAAWSLGAIVVPLNTLLQTTELEQALRSAGVQLLLSAARFLRHDYLAKLQRMGVIFDARGSRLRCRALPALEQVILASGSEPHLLCLTDLQTGTRCSTASWLASVRSQVTGSDPAAIFFTSGTTAQPKRVVHSHASMLAAATNVADCLGLDQNDRTWGYLPFFFAGGLVAVALATLSRGGAVLLQDVFEPGVTLQLLSQHGCTTFFAWPHQAAALIEHPAFRQTALRIRKGPGAQSDWAARLFAPDHQAVGTWGMTETGPMAISTRWNDPLEERASAHGRPQPGVEIRLIDAAGAPITTTGQEGELCVRGATLMQRYDGVPHRDCFDADGFFHTGDLARVDGRGLVHFLGRIKDVIKTAGVNVAAAEVESALLEHPAVKAAYVVGSPDAKRGENVVAFVVPHQSSASEEQLVAHCRERLASYKVPRRILFCREDELPLLGSGKVDKQALRRRAAEPSQPAQQA